MNNGMYLAFQVDSKDAARSLSNYFNQHGIEAGTDGFTEVSCDLSDEPQYSQLLNLRKMWELFREKELQSG